MGDFLDQFNENNNPGLLGHDSSDWRGFIRQSLEFNEIHCCENYIKSFGGAYPVRCEVLRNCG